MTQKIVSGQPSQEWRKAHAAAKEPKPELAPLVSGSDEEITARVLRINTFADQLDQELRGLFVDLEGRVGHREVQFSGGNRWTTSTWCYERRDLALQRHVDPLHLHILSVNPGSKP